MPLLSALSTLIHQISKTHTHIYTLNHGKNHPKRRQLAKRAFKTAAFSFIPLLHCAIDFTTLCAATHPNTHRLFLHLIKLRWLEGPRKILHRTPVCDPETDPTRLDITYRTGFVTNSLRRVTKPARSSD